MSGLRVPYRLGGMPEKNNANAGIGDAKAVAAERGNHVRHSNTVPCHRHDT